MKQDNYTNTQSTSFSRWMLFAGIAIASLFATGANAQVTTNSGSGLAATYTDLASAISALNAASITSPVVITLTASNPQTAPIGGYTITASGTSTNTITIEGNNNDITAYTPQASGTLHDCLFEIVGGDYITIDNFNLLENASNTTTAAGSNNMTEFGVALFYASTTNGAQNCTIKNCDIDLNRTYQNTFGIYSNSTHASTSISTTASAVGATGGNSSLIITNNTITDVNIGIVVVGPTAAADQNDGLTIGGSGAGNSITNYGTIGTFSSYANVSGTVNGMLIRNTKNMNVSYNTVETSAGGVTAGTVRGIYLVAPSAASTGTFTNTFDYNQISIRSGSASSALTGIAVESTSATATSSLSISNNNFYTFGHTVSGTAAVILISNTATALNQNINTNTFTNISLNTTGSFTFITCSNTVPAGGTQNINSNSIVTGFNKTGAGGTVTGITSGGSSTTVTQNWNTNTFSNITVTGATTVTIINNTDGGSVNHNIMGNTISNITGGTSTVTGINSSFGGTNGGSGNLVSGNTISSISSGGTVSGITIGSSGTSSTVELNTISGLSTTGASTVSGITSAAPTSCTIQRNKICDLQSNNASGAVTGILVSAGTLHNVVNNTIGDLRTPASNASNPLIGLNITGGTTVNAYYNTVSLNGTSSGALFGSSAISASTTPALTLRNNIFHNTSTPNGAGATVAYRRSTTTLTSYNAASNHNLFYAGTPGAANLIFSDGTNFDQTLAAYKSRVTARDNSSVTENLNSAPTFLGTTCANSDFLHMSTSVATQAESGGADIAGITVDFDGNTRNATTPDIGADEFSGIGADFVAPSITYTAFLNGNCTSTRTLVATITDLSGVNVTSGTNPRIYFKKSTNADADGGTNDNTTDGWKFVETLSGSSPFDMVVDPSLIFGGVTAGDVIQYFVVAQDLAGTPNLGINSGSFAAAQTSVALAGSAFPIGGSVNSYTITSTALAATATPSPASLCVSGVAAVTAGATGGTPPYTYSWTPGAATTAVISTGTITTTTDYTVTVSGACGGVATASTTVVVNNPSIGGTTAGSRCGTGSVSLQATGVGTLNWYTASTGGTSLGSGSPFSTPSISTSTTYYVGAGYFGANVNAAIGLGATTSSSSSVSPFYHGYGGQKSQFIILASELTGAGFSAGNVNSLSFEITSLGTATLNGFAISMGNTAQAAAVTNTAITGLTQVYSNAAQTLTTGLNTYACTGFAWNGTSNLVVQVCYSNNNSGGSSSTVKADVAAFTGSLGIYADNATSSAVCAATSSTGLGSLSSNGTSATRPQMTLAIQSVCESARTAVVATITNAPSISIAGTATICSGQSTTLTVSSSNDPDYSYTWSTTETTAAISVSPVTTTTYSVNAIDNTAGPNAGCTAVASQLVTVNASPSAVTVSPSTSEVCVGGGSVLTASGGGLPAVQSNSIVVSLSNPATDETTVCPGANQIASFTLPAIPGGAIGARLTINGVTLNGGTYGTEVRLNFSGSGVTANSTCFQGITTTTSPNPADWITGASVAADTATLAGLLNPAGGTVVITYNEGYNDNASAPDATFPATATLQYYYNGSAQQAITWTPAASGLNTYSGPTVTASPTVATTYTATATGPNGCTASGTADVTMHSSSAAISGTATTCSGQATDLTFNFTGTAPYSVTYNDGTGNTTVSGIATSSHTVSVSPTTTTTYTIASASDALCSVEAGDISGSAVISVNANPTASITGTSTICIAGSTTLTASTTGTITSYAWSDGSPVGLDQDTYNATAVGSYTVTVTSDLGCTATSAPFVVSYLQYTITSSTGPDGTISPLGAVSVDCGGNQTFTITPDAARFIDDVLVDAVSQGVITTYTFTNVTANHTISATFNSGPCAVPATADAGPNASICPEGTHTLAGSIGGSANTGTWSTSGTGSFSPSTDVATATTYTPSSADSAAGSVTLTLTTDDPDGGGSCVAAVSSMTLSFHVSPTASITGQLEICPSGSTTLDAGATAGSGTITGYQWVLNGSTNLGTAATQAASAIGSYTVTVTNSNGCSYTSAAVTTIAANAPTASIGGATILCSGVSETLTATASAGSGTISTYQWILNGSTNVGTNSSTYSASATGSYTVRVTNSFGCSVTSAPHVLTASGPLSGTYTISTAPASCTNYNTFAAAISDLNTKGVAGNVVFNVDAGFTVTAPAGGLILNQCALAASLKSGPTQTVIFQKSGAGANPLITAYTPGTSTTTDGVIKVVGMDNVTFDQIDIQENASNTTATQQMEMALGVYKCSGNDGAVNVTFSNGTITLNKANTAAIAVRVANTTHLSATALVYSALAGNADSAAASRNRVNILNNTISNVYGAVLLNANAGSTAPHSLNDSLSVISGNIISNFAGTSTAATIISVNDNRGFSIANNSLNGGASQTGALTGISGGGGPYGSITGNTVTLASTTNLTGAIIGIIYGSSGTNNNAAITGNTVQNCSFTAATTATFTAISSGNSGTTSSVTFSSNNVLNNTVNGTGTWTGITNTSTPVTLVMNSNTVSGNSKTGTAGAGTMTLFAHGGGGTLTVSSNTITGNSMTPSLGTATLNCATGGTATYVFDSNTITGNYITTASSGSSAATVTGYSNAASALNETISNNTINNLYVAGSSTGSHQVRGIVSNTLSTSIRTVSGNVIHTLYSTGSAAVTGIISTACSTAAVSKNKIYNLYCGQTAGTAVLKGISVTSGSNTTVSNNLIGIDITPYTPVLTGSNAVIGIEVTGGTASNLYYNTIRLAGDGNGTGFGSSGISLTSATPTVSINNNLVLNLTGAGGLAAVNSAVGLRRAAAALAGYSSTSNRNVWYAGSPSASHLLYYDGTNSSETMTSFKGLVAPAESSSGSENTVLLSTTGANANFLHVDAATATIAESGGANIGGITTDYDNDIRQGNGGYAGTGTSPDVGADEFAGINAAPLLTNIVLTPGAACVAQSHSVSVDVTTAAGTITQVQLSYSFNGTAQTPLTLTSPTSGSTYTFTIPAATPTNALVTWTLTATNSGSVTSSAIGTSYRDEYLSGFTITANASPTTVCGLGDVNLSVSSVNSYYAEAFESASFPLTAFTASGTSTTAVQESTYFSEGASSVLFNTTATSATALLTGNVDINLAGLSSANLTFSHQCLMEGSSFSYDYGYVEYSLNGGVNWITFPAANYSGGATLLGTGSQGFTTRSYADWITAFTSSASLPSNSLWKTESYSIPAAALTSQFRIRFRYTTDSSTNFYGWLIDNVKVTATVPFAGTLAYSWTSSPSGFTASTATATANPLVSTTYTGTITDANGCSLSAPTATVTTLPIPAAPSAMNSTQCGNGIPTCSVSGTSGATFNWYSAAAGGTPLQSGLSTTYLTSINVSTTFYVAEVGMNGCPGERVAVVATVTIPDAIDAKVEVSAVEVTNVCPGTLIDLSVTKASGTNTYDYTWTANPSSGSGISGSLTGNPVSTTPTTPGTYKYIVTAVDIPNGCTIQDSATLIVNNVPFISSVSAVPSTVCSGGPVVLKAVTPTGSGNIPSGTSTTTEFNGVYRNGFGTGDFRHQLLFTAAELTTAGLTASNITSLTFTVTSAGSGSADNYTIRMANTAATALTSTVLAATLTPVYTATTYTAIAGANLHTFNAPFAWNGTSNVLIDICYTISSIGGSSTLAATTPAFIGNVNILGGLNACTSTGAVNTIANRPVVTFGYAGFGPGSYTWAWEPGSISGNEVTANPTVNTTYTVTATDPATTCTNSATVNVTVNPTPPAPTAFDGDHCGNQTPTCYVVRSQPGTTFNWYTVASGGTPIAGQNDSILHSYPRNQADVFYVAEVYATGPCEGPRAMLTETHSAADAITATATVPNDTICPFGTVALSATQGTTNTYTTYTWTTIPAGGSASGQTTSATVPNTPGQLIWQVVASDGLCSVTAYDTIVVITPPILASVTASTNNICPGTSVTLTATATGIATGEATLGTGGLQNTTSSYPAPFGAYYYGAKNQMLLTAAELTASGLVAGPITSLAFDVVSPDVSALTNFSIGIKNSGLAALSSTPEVGFTTVYANASYVPANATGYAANTIVFDNAYVWNGTSNIIIETCFNNSGYSDNAVFSLSGTTNASTASYYDDISTVCSGTPAPAYFGVYLGRPNMRLGGQIAVAGAGPYTWTWNPGSLPGNVVSVSPSVTTNYTVTVQDPSSGGCYNEGYITVNVYDEPLAPLNPTSSVQCGPGVPTASVSNSGPGTDTFRWYTVPTGGTPLAGETGPSLTGVVSVSTDYYVAEFNGNCEGPRVLVSVTVNLADPININVTTANLCLPSTLIDMEAVQTGTTSNYAFTWSASPSGTAGLGTPSGPNGTLVSAVPTAVGTYTYTVSAYDAGANCTFVSSYTASVNNYPVINAASANPSTVCAGSDVNLSATILGIASDTSSLGASTGTSSSSPTPYGHAYGGMKAQYIILASEMTAKGFVAGNITELAFDVTAVGTTYSGFAIGMDATAQTSFATATALPATQRYAAASVTPVLGLNTYNFGGTPFNWNGTSNIVVSVCWSNNNGGGTSATVRTTTPGFTSSMYILADNAASAATCAAITTTNPVTLGTLRTSGTSTSRPRMVLTGQRATNTSASYSWTWNPGSLSGNNVTVNPTVTTDYTVTAASGTCTDDSIITVTVNPLPATPTATNSSQCGVGTPDCSVSGSTGTFRWYLVPTGGSPLGGQSGTTLVSYPIGMTTTFYVSEFDGTCESVRVAVTQTVQIPDLVTALSSADTICLGSPVTLTANQTGSNNTYTFTWTVLPDVDASGITTSATGSPLTITPTAAGSYVYTVNSVDGLCNAAASSKTVVVLDNPVINAGADVTLCSGSSTTLTAIGAANGGIGSNSVSISLSNPTTNEGTACPGANTIASFTLPPIPGTPIGARLTITGVTLGSGSYGTEVKLNFSGAGIIGTSPCFQGATTTTSPNPFNYITGSSTAGDTATLAALLNPAGGTIVIKYNDSFNDVTSGPDATFPATATLQYFYALPAPTVTWTSIPSGITGTGATLNTGALTSSTQFVATATNSFGCATKDTVDVTVVTTPGVGTITSTSDTVCTSGSVTLTATGIAIGSTVAWESSTTGPGGPFNPIGATGLTYTTPTLTATTHYRVQATCSATEASNVKAIIVAAPTVSAMGATRCGYGQVTLTTTAGSIDDVVTWYTASSGGTAVYTGGTYVTNVAATTTYYVQSNIGTCVNPGGRVTVTATVNTAPAISFTASSNSVCEGTSVTLTASSANLDYTYYWSTDGGTTTAYTGNPYIFTPTATLTYSLIAVDNTTGNPSSGCGATTPAQVVTVNPVPPAPIVSPATSTICTAGGSTTLTVTNPITPIAGNASVGTDVTTTTSSGYLPYDLLWEGAKKQYLFTVAELNAAGLTAGPITSLSFNVTVGTTVIPLTNYQISMAHSALTDMSTAFETVGLTTVYGPTNYTPTTGVNTHPVTGFTWNGTSNLIVDICFDNDAAGTCTGGSGVCYGSSVTTLYTTSSFVSVRGNYGDNSGTPRVMCDGLVGTTVSGTTRPNIVFAGQIAPAVTYTWTPGLQTGLSVSVSPTINTNYTVTATLGPCSSIGTAVVNYNPVSVSITPSGSTSFCGSGSVDLDAGSGFGSYEWSDGTSVISTSQMITATPTATTTYTVTVTSGPCTVSATQTVTVNPLVAIGISPSSTVPLCGGVGSITLTADAGYSNYLWTPGSETTQAISVSPLATTTYTVTATDGNMCTQTGYYTVVSNPAPATPVITPASPAILCWDGAGPDVSLFLTADTTGALFGSICYWDDFASTPDLSLEISTAEYGLGLVTRVFTVETAEGCIATATATVNIVNCPAGANVEMRVFLEGFLMEDWKMGNGGDTMQSTLYLLETYAMLPGPYATTATDTITVNLWSAASVNLGNPDPDYSEKVILNNNGRVSVNFPTAAAGDYFIAVKHRNHMETWSADPVTFSVPGISTYDFSTALTQAYTDLSNPPMKSMPFGVYALYGGEVNQDGGVDLNDASLIDNDAFAFGYNPTDCTGDVGTDLSDQTIVDNNQVLFLFYQRPYFY